MNDKDTIYRQTAIDEIDEWIKAFRENGHKESAADACLIQDGIIKLPSAQPIYTDAEIQKMQDLESAQIEKAYQLGYEDGKKDAQQDFDIDQKINKAYDDGYDQGYLQCRADQERTTGHWIERQKKGSARWQSWCSVCGKHSGIGGIESNRHKPFCPNCGSPMEGVVYDV